MKSVTQLAHVAFRVKDVERSLAFYVGKLKFPEMFRLHRDGKLWIVYLRVTDDQYIELFPDGVGERAPGRESTGMNHLCLGVDSIDDAVAELAEAGVPLITQKKLGVDYNYQAWIEDPDGNRIEIMQILPKAMQLDAIRSMKAGNHKVPVYNV